MYKIKFKKGGGGELTIPVFSLNEPRRRLTRGRWARDPPGVYCIWLCTRVIA